MKNPSRTAAHVRRPDIKFQSIARWGAIPFLLLMLAGTGCHNRNAMQVQLSAHESADKDLWGLEIEAQVTGPQSDLSYRWFATSGSCEPQESDTPSTAFKFAQNAGHDNVSLEVWRGGKCVARGAVNVTLDPDKLRTATEHVNDVRILITNIPPYDFNGGSFTHAAIGGLVSGHFDSGDKVVIYARAVDVWYIQPLMNYEQPISHDGVWTNWTHTGCNYAALVVRPGYYPERRLDALPPIGVYVIAKTIVEGLKK
ncbi:MAG TPA: hypothetical protein VG347_10240 [Verrucomicrobiae bacterium]|nr:hypothetical protein [Verrucomicrobiae bacterium]